MVLKMKEVNCVIETKGDDMGLALQVMELTPAHLGNLSMWQFLQGDCTGMLLTKVKFSSFDACAEICFCLCNTIRSLGAYVGCLPSSLT